MGSRSCKRGGSLFPGNGAAVLIHGLLLLCSFMGPLCLKVEGGSCLESERRSLLALKAANPVAAAGLLSSWRGEDCCSWSGVGCDNATGHVIHLRLPGPDWSYDSLLDYPFSTGHDTQRLVEVTPSLIGLTRLNYLDLSSNDFHRAPIPKFIGALVNLEFLNLSNAMFSGTIPPQLGNLSSLHYLDLNFNIAYYLSFNDFSFDAPDVDSLDWLPRIPSLRYLDMSFVNLSKATNWFHDINMLPFLTVLRLSESNLHGIIPATLPHNNLSSLVTLDLSHNHIRSTIPLQWLFNISTLVHIDLSWNEFNVDLRIIPGNLMHLIYLDLSGTALINGEIPETIGNLSHLKFLYLNHNRINGEIPETIGNLSNLQQLALSDNNISGRIPETIGKLYKLQYLDLYENNLDGELPRSMGSLCALIELDLSSNRIGGEVTHLVQGLSTCIPSGALKTLDVSDNGLNGNIPESLGLLHGLVVLNLRSNSLTGTLAEIHFANLTNLDSLDLSYNLLAVNVSPSWVPPFQAAQLILCSCQLGPKFPPWLQSQNIDTLCLSEAGIFDVMPAWLWQSVPQFNYFNVSHNHMQGRLPPFSTTSMNIVVFDVSFNSFQGPIPNLNSSELIMIDLSNNFFSGVIPSSFAAALQPDLFNLAYNGIHGSIPSFFCEMNSLLVLDLSNNDLAGGLPRCWNKTSRLVILDLSNNYLSGKIPRTIRSLTRLRSLHLRNNSLSGEIPRSLKHCKTLVTLDVGENRLSGSIPPWIGESLSLLRLLRLSSNVFIGSIPIQLSLLTFLQVLDLAHNNLSGGVPPAFGNLSSMVAIHNEVYGSFYSIGYETGIGWGSSEFGSYYLESLLVTTKGEQLEYTKTGLTLVTSMDLSSNRLSGEIPEELTNLHRLYTLNLSRNHFTGRIPENIGDMRRLESLDLSNNNISGSIPSNMSALNFLSHLDLSNNDLSGRIPSGQQFKTFSDPSIYEGNHGLCGWPLVECPGDAPSQNSPHIDDQEGEDAGSEAIWLYASIAFGFIVGFWGFIGTVMIKRTIRFAYFQWIDGIYDRAYFYLRNGR